MFAHGEVEISLILYLTYVFVCISMFSHIFFSRFVCCSILSVLYLYLLCSPYLEDNKLSIYLTNRLHEGM